MQKKDDSVFQVSLTEIAFTLVLLILLLLGQRIVEMLYENKAQQEEIISKNAQISRYEHMLKEANKFGGMCTPDPEDPLDTMMPCVKCLSVAGRLSKEEAAQSIELGRSLVEQWKAQRSKLSYNDYAKKLFAAAEQLAQGKNLIDSAEKDKAVAALDKANAYIQQLQNERDQLNSYNEQLKNEHNQLSSYKSELDKVTAYNEQLAAQNAYLQRRAGMDDPPCWLTADYRPQYLLSVVILPDMTYQVAPNWPAAREEEAYAIPGVREMVEKKHLTRGEFNRYGALILDHSKQMKPQSCRYFVTIRNQVEKRSEGDVARLNVEQFFYKYEIVE